MKTRRIIVACSGNICRSPMAAAMLKPMLAQAQLPAVVISAGTLNLLGQSAAAHAQDAMTEIGVDLTEHRSQGLSPQFMRLADAIIVMSPEHVAFIQQHARDVMPRVVKLWEYYPEDAPEAPLSEIVDPVGRDRQAFRACRDVLQQCLSGWVSTLS